MDGPPAPQSWLLHTNTQQLDPFHTLLCLSPGSLTGSAAPRTELTFREIVYQLHSMDSLFPNPGTTSHLPWTVTQYITVQECTVWSPFFRRRQSHRQIMWLDQGHTESEHWVKERTHVLIPEPMLFLTTRLDWSLDLPAGFPQYWVSLRSASTCPGPWAQAGWAIPPTTWLSPGRAGGSSGEGPGEGTDTALRNAFHFNNKQ